MDISFSETSVNFQLNTQRYIAEDNTLQTVFHVVTLLKKLTLQLAVEAYRAVRRRCSPTF
jgi:hypothetical protein